MSPMRKMVGVPHIGVADQGAAAKPGLQAPSGVPELVPPSGGLAHTMAATRPSGQGIESAAALHIAPRNAAAPASVAITAADTTGIHVDEPRPPQLIAALHAHTPSDTSDGPASAIHPRGFPQTWRMPTQHHAYPSGPHLLDGFRKRLGRVCFLFPPVREEHADYVLWW